VLLTQTDPILEQKIANAIATDAGQGVVLLMGLVALVCGYLITAHR